MHAELLEALRPIARQVAALDLDDPEEATRRLEAAFSDEELDALDAMLLRAHEAGTLTPRSAGPSVAFGRLAKPGEETASLSIDAVVMSGEAAEHTHPKGEVSYCVPLEGTPHFDGHRSRWVVLPPHSHHTPTVGDGTMLIVYFLPEGAVTWGPRQDAQAS